MRVQRRHLDVLHRGIEHAHALHDFTVNHGATAVADELQRRREQVAAGLGVQVGQRGIQRVGRGLGETGIADVGLLDPVRHQNHRLAGLQRSHAHRVGDRVDPLTGVLVVDQHRAAAGGFDDDARQFQEGCGLLIRRVAQLGQRVELEAVRQHGDDVVGGAGLHRLGVEAAGFLEGLAVGQQAHTPEVGLARRHQLGNLGRQRDLVDFGRQDVRGPEPVRVVVGAGPTGIRLEQRGALTRRVVGPQALAGLQRAEIDACDVLGGAQRVGVDVPLESDGLGALADLQRASGRQQGERVVGLNGKPAHVARHRNARQVDHRIFPVDRLLGVVNRGARIGGLVQQRIDVEHQHVARPAVIGVQLLAVGRQLQLGSEGQRDRRGRGKDLRRTPETERILDDADLGPGLVRVHVLDHRARRVRAHRHRHIPVDNEGPVQVGRDHHVHRVADVELVLLLGVVRQLQVHGADLGGEAQRVVVGDGDGLQATQPLALEPRGEHHLVGLGRGRDAVGLQPAIEVGDNLVVLAQVGRMRHFDGGLRLVGLVDVDHQHLAGVTAALYPGLGTAEQLGGWRRDVQPCAISVDGHVVDLAGGRIRRIDGDDIYQLVQRGRTRVDVDDEHRPLASHVEVVAVGVEHHRGGRLAIGQLDIIQLWRAGLGVHGVERDAVDDHNGTLLVATGDHRRKDARQVGRGRRGHCGASQVDDLDDLLRATDWIAFALGIDDQHAIGPVAGRDLTKTRRKGITALVADVEDRAVGVVGRGAGQAVGADHRQHVGAPHDDVGQSQHHRFGHSHKDLRVGGRSIHRSLNRQPTLGKHHLGGGDLGRARLEVRSLDGQQLGVGVVVRRIGVTSDDRRLGDGRQRLRHRGADARIGVARVHRDLEVERLVGVLGVGVDDLGLLDQREGDRLEVVHQADQAGAADEQQRRIEHLLQVDRQPAHRLVGACHQDVAVLAQARPRRRGAASVAIGTDHAVVDRHPVAAQHAVGHVGLHLDEEIHLVASL